MKHYFFALLFFCTSSFGQLGNLWTGEVMMGTTSYNGDLVQGNFPIKRLGMCLGGNVKYNYNPHFSFRAGLNYGRIFGDDKKNTDPELIQRGLSFKSHLIEFNAGCEYNYRSLEDYFFTPYAFAGLGVFHFNPYTFDSKYNKIFLNPLHTEGQGLSNFPDRKNYSLYQFTIPVGIGFKYSIAPNLMLSYEFDYHIIFTDYLDDVSKTYVPLEELKENFGDKSAEMSFRQKDVDFNLRLGEKRGDNSNRDVYYYNVIKLSTYLDYRSF